MRLYYKTSLVLRLYPGIRILKVLSFAQIGILTIQIVDIDFRYSGRIRQILFYK